MFTYYKIIKSIINNSPQLPGVYVFLNKNKEVIYVGKAIRLKTRLNFYIDKNVLSKYPKTLKMVQESYNLKYYTTNTEAEALILEANLIKKYSPKFNVNLKDGKNYKLIEISKDNTNTYKVKIVRKKSIKASYFGPFPRGNDVIVVLKSLRKIFPYRDCSFSKFTYYKKLNRPCLYGQLGLCFAPCQGEKQNKLNSKSIAQIKRFLGGESSQVIKKLKNEMLEYSKDTNYEQAMEIKKRLNTYEYLSNKYKSETELLEGVGDVGSESYKISALINLLSPYFLLFSKAKINPYYLDTFRIEFFDISNLSNEIIVGASTCIIGGRVEKNYYRKYKIKNQEGLKTLKQNDFEAIRQIVYRRLNYISKWGKPDLIVIDGGKGQLSSALKVTNKYKIPTISLAKKEEEIFLKTSTKFVKIRLPKNNDALNVLIKGRNEVHRFGITYNRSLRNLNKEI